MDLAAFLYLFGLRWIIIFGALKVKECTICYLNKYLLLIDQTWIKCVIATIFVGMIYVVLHIILCCFSFSCTMDFLFCCYEFSHSWLCFEVCKNVILRKFKKEKENIFKMMSKSNLPLTNLICRKWRTKYSKQNAFKYILITSMCKCID